MPVSVKALSSLLALLPWVLVARGIQMWSVAPVAGGLWLWWARRYQDSVADGQLTIERAIGNVVRCLGNVLGRVSDE